MHYDHPEIIEPALEVIKANDPDLYAAMQRSHWDVHVITDMDDDPMRLSTDGDNERDQLHAEPDDEALTSVVLPGKPTDVILPAMKAHQDYYDAPFAHALASNLVHEFQHHHGLGEVSAYSAAGKFAAKLGDKALTENSELGLIYSAFGISLKS